MVNQIQRTGQLKFIAQRAVIKATVVVLLMAALALQASSISAQTQASPQLSGPMQVSVSVSPANPEAGETAVMTASVSNAPAGASLSYSWQLLAGSEWVSFGGGSTFRYRAYKKETWSFRVVVTAGSSTASSSVTVTWTAPEPTPTPTPEPTPTPSDQSQQSPKSVDPSGTPTPEPGSDQASELSQPLTFSSAPSQFDFNLNEDIGTETLPEATGGAGGFTYSLSGLPAGLSFDAASRALTGTPTQIGTHPVIYTATDANGLETGVSFNIVVFGTALSTNATISLSVSPSSISEGQDEAKVVVTATRSGDTTSADTITLSLGGTATDGTDYRLWNSLGLEIAKGSASVTKTLTFTVIEDTAVEGDETIIVSGTASSGQTVNSALITINEVAPTPPDITLSVSPTSFTEGNSADVTVMATRTGNTENSETITLSLGGTATKDTDYGVKATLPTITFNTDATSATATLNFTSVGDTAVEGDETIVVSGSSSTSGRSVSDATITLTDSAPDITLSVSPSSIAEGAVNSAINLTATRASAGGRVQILYSLGGTATAGVPGDTGYDYSVTSLTTLILEPTETTKTVSLSFTVLDDTEYEKDETIVFQGTNSGISISPTTLSITDNDTAIALSVSTSSFTEGYSANITVKGTRSGNTANSETVTLALGGTADNLTDYGVQATLPTLTFNAGATTASATLNFTSVDDAATEGDETITVSGTSSATGTTVSGATITIKDNDSAPDITLSVSPSSISEGNSAASVTVTATRTGTSGDVTVSLRTQGGTATDGIDFTAWTWPSLTIDDGETSGTATLTFTVWPDTEVEGSETIIVTGTASGLTVSDTLVYVGDDDTAIALSVSTSSFTEGYSANITVKGTRSGNTVNSETVTLSLCGTADNPADYGVQATLPTLTFNAGATTATATLNFTSVDDTATEGNETITVSGTSSATGTTVSGATITINDNETASDITLSVSPSSINEGANSANVTVTATRTGTSGAVTVALRTDGGTATDGFGRDFIAWTWPSLTIADGETSGTATLTFTAFQDTEVEGTETIIVSGTAEGLTVSDTVVSITDDDIAPDITLSVSPDSFAENDGDDGTEITVTATLGSAASQDVTVTLSLANTTASSGDYSVSGTQSITISASETSGTTTLTFNGVDDIEMEGNEAITVSGTATGYAVSDVVITITDNEDASGLKPGTPTVTRTTFSQPSSPALDVSWTAPSATVTGYKAQYRKQGDTNWTASSGALSATTTSLTLPNLEAGATYEVQVRALSNSGGEGPWSDTGSARANRPPVFPPYIIPHYREPWGDVLQQPISVSDADGDTLTYSATSKHPGIVAASGHKGSFVFRIVNPASTSFTYEVQDPYGGYTHVEAQVTGIANETRSVAENSAGGTHVGRHLGGKPYQGQALTHALKGEVATSGLFTLDATTGQLTVAAGASLDYETKNSYTGTVEFTIQGQPAVINLTVQVTDVTGPAQPDAPSVGAPAPNVQGPSESGNAADPSTQLGVSWTAPDDLGSAITGYWVQYRVAGESDWTAHDFSGTGTETTITGLASDTSYEVQVLAQNGEGNSSWSESGTGSTQDERAESIVATPAPAPPAAPQPGPTATPVPQSTATPTPEPELAPLPTVTPTPTPPASDLPLPDAPAGLDARCTDPTTIAVSWNVVEGADGYEFGIWIGDGWKDEFQTGTSATRSGLNINTRYNVRVRARGDGQARAGWSLHQWGEEDTTNCAPTTIATPTPTPEPTPEPTPTAIPTREPQAEATQPTPTPVPTAIPTPEPTPIPEPTATPAPEPTPTPEPSPQPQVAQGPIAPPTNTNPDDGAGPPVAPPPQTASGNDDASGIAGIINDPNAITVGVGVGLLGLILTTLAAQYLGLLSILEVLLNEARRTFLLTFPRGAGPIAILTLLGLLLLPFLRRRRRGVLDAPRVTRSDSDPMHALDVAWNTPVGYGATSTRYDVQYRAPGAGWISYARTNLTWIELFGLEPGVRYGVRIRVRSSAEPGPWSPTGSASTDGDADMTALPSTGGLLRARNDAGTSFGD